MLKRINWKIAGSAGHGIKSIGAIMARALLLHKWFVYGYDEYPSLIRGGQNTYQLLISNEKVTAPQKKIDILVALNEEGISNHLEEITEDTIVIKDKELKIEILKGKVWNLAILEMAKTLGNPLVQNTILLGVTAQMFALKDEAMRDLVKTEFGKKQELLELNIRAYEEGRKMVVDREQIDLSKGSREGSELVMSGSEAAGMGAIAAGMQAYFAYPMTPSSPLLHFLAENQEKFDYLVRQPEDEIAAINMALGASFAGAKSMVGTAGGGFALMQESVSLAGMLELPLVIYVGMRPAPATGLPTWTSQSDLRFVIYSGHGEFPKIVLSPGDTNEVFDLVHKAFELSQKYQVTVIVLTDKLLAEAHQVTEEFPSLLVVPLQNIEWRPTQPEGEMYHRYQPTPDGVGKRTLPGIVNGIYIANSDEHTPEGLVSETAEMRQVMNLRRSNKMKLIADEAIAPTIYGDAESSDYLVSFGSTKGSILEALKELPGMGFCHFTQVWPISSQAVEMLRDKRLTVVENNMTGQLAGLLKQELGLKIETNLCKDDGRPFYPEEIVQFMKEKR